MSLFVGFDEPDTNENFFELFRSGSPYLSLYHHCRVTEITYPDDGHFSVYLEKVFDSGFGPPVGSKVILSLENATLESLHSSTDGNFEDLDEVVCIHKNSHKLLIKLVISGVDFYVRCQKIVLHVPEAN